MQPDKEFKLSNTNYKLLFLIIIVIYTWLITYGSFDLFKGERFGIAYDSLSQSLLHGDCVIEPHTIGWEAFSINGKTYMYFGLWPSLLRIIFNYLFPSLYGSWSRISCLLAAALSLLGFMLAIYMYLKENNFLSNEHKKFFFNISLISFGLGSPLFYLTSLGYIYHESILWGFCWSIWGIYFLNKLLLKKDKPTNALFKLSICTGLALLSRTTFSIPLYIILILIFITIFSKTFSSSLGLNINPLVVKKHLLKTLLLFTPALIAIVFQLWYNECRFGSITTFVDYKYHYNWSTSWWSEHDKNVIEQFGLFNLKRIPTSISGYFGLWSENFSNKLPFFKMLPSKHLDTSLRLGFTEWNISILLVSIWIIWGAFIGFIWLMKTKNNIFQKLCTVSFFVEAILILSYIGISYRYNVDFFPFLIFLYLQYLSQIGKQNSLIKLNIIILLSKLLCLISISSTILSTLDWICYFETDLPPVALDYREFLKKIFASITKFITTT